MPFCPSVCVFICSEWRGQGEHKYFLTCAIDQKVCAPQIHSYVHVLIPNVDLFGDDVFRRINYNFIHTP